VRLTFLGSGGAFSDYRVNYHNNAFIETAEGLVLIDCGTTAVQSLKELGYHPRDVRAVLFTHLHGDHASPEQLMWERFYGPDADGEPGFASTTLCAPADILDPLRRSLRHFMDIFTDRTGTIREGGVETLVDPLPTMQTELAGLQVRFFRVPHVAGASVDKAAYGIDLSDGRDRILWSGDTTLSPDWVNRAATDSSVARIFHECSFLPPYRGTVHSHWSELSELPDETLARITLMHHTVVPPEVDLSRTVGAAARHEVFEL